MSTELFKLLDAIEGKRIAVIGDLMVDRYTWGRVTRISPEAPVPVVEITHTTASPGGAANAAVCAGALGARVTLFGATGGDDSHDDLERMVADGSCAARFLRLPGMPTITKHRIWSGGQQLLRLDSEQAIEPSAPTAFLTDHFDAREFDAVLVSDYGKGFVSRDSFEVIRDASRAAGVAVVVDPKVADFTVYAGATVIKPNEREAQLAFAHRHQRPATSVDEIGRYLTAEVAERAVITRGGDGASYFSADGSGTVPVESQTVYDVTGAGDVVAAMVTALMAVGADLADACSLANHAARVCVGRVGTGGVTRLDVIGSIEGHPGTPGQIGERG